MTINLFFITLTLSISKRKKTKNDIHRDQEIQNRMEEVKTKQYENFHNM
ncbi:YrzI family protein [Bacillus sp. UMB0899]|nr:YrzI family small protein [Metabacillus schmidteae]PMC39708.1 YrzI family protein [Bacillus sp. UMB0899]